MENTAAQPGRVELDTFGSGAIEQFTNARLAADKTAICIVPQEDVRRLSSIGNDDGTGIRGAACTAYILIEFPAGNLCH
jgi:hypothetical protein